MADEAAVHSAAFFLLSGAAGMIGLERWRPLAYTQQQADDLRAAIASGQLLVRSGDRQVQYRSLDEMRRLLSDMEAEISSGTPRRRSRGYFRMRAPS